MSVTCPGGQAELDKQSGRQPQPPTTAATTAATPDLPHLIAKLEREVQKCVSTLDPDNGELDAVQARLVCVDADDRPVAALPPALRAWLIVQLSMTVFCM